MRIIYVYTCIYRYIHHVYILHIYVYWNIYIYIYIHQYIYTYIFHRDENFIDFPDSVCSYDLVGTTLQITKDHFCLVDQSSCPGIPICCGGSDFHLESDYIRLFFKGIKGWMFDPSDT